MAVSPRTGRSRFTLAILVLVSLTVLTLDFRESSIVQGAREVALDVMGPMSGAADWLVTPFRNVWNGITRYDSLEAENAQLRAQLEEAEGRALAGEGAAAERDALMQLQGITFARGIPAVSARVVAAPVSNFDVTMEINRGSNDGVAEGMPVVSGAGLVGRVVRAGQTRSVVRLITDPTFNVGVVLSSSRDFGVARGAGRNEPLDVGYIETDTQVAPDELLKTSGLEESLFPPDIPVARVVESKLEDGALELRVRAQPVVDLDRVAFVKVLQWQPR